MAIEKIQRDKILPDFIKFKIKSYDDQCDEALATIFAIDASTKECSHFLIGPSCEYSVCKQIKLKILFFQCQRKIDVLQLLSVA